MIDLRTQRTLTFSLWALLLHACGSHESSAGREVDGGHGEGAVEPEASANDASAGTTADGSAADGVPDDAGSEHFDEDAGDAAIACPGDASSPDEVRVEQGLLRGGTEEVDGTTVRSFLGVPYAAPPIGVLRFAPPAPPACFGTRVSTSFGPACPQLDRQSGEFAGEEDCLRLNLWAPASATDAPVLVFIHGGGNVFGSASETLGDGIHRRYQGARLASHGNAVVVTINYRLGILGFLSHPDLDAEQPSGPSTSFGILDQIAALRWVQRNIAAFGGDPSRVLLFGESGGARDVCVHLASPLSVGLFSAAMMESGSCLVPPREAVLAATREQIEASGCSGAPQGEIACLRGIGAEQLLADYAPPTPPLADPVEVSDALQPHVDGHVLPLPPEQALATGVGSDVPFVVGVNARESSILVGNAVATRADYELTVRAAFPDDADAILAQYPIARFANARDAFINLSSDARFVCPARRAARAASAGRSAPVYRYVFDQGLTQTVLGVYGAYHGVELAYVFDSVGEGAYPATAEEQTLALAVATYWSAFANSGAPAASSLPTWPQFTAESDRYLNLSAAAIAEDAGFHAADCDFWDTIR